MSPTDPKAPRPGDRDEPVLVELQGRTGNQLFGYALGVAIESRTGRPVRYLADHRDPSHYTLPQILTAPPRLASPDERRRAGIVDGRSLRASLERRARRARRRLPAPLAGTDAAWDEPGPFSFDERVFTLSPPRVLRGYFQNERYFRDVAGPLAATIRLPSLELPDHIDAGLGRTAAVQFRRGDFVGLGWTLPLDFYDRAIDALLAEAELDALVLIGDDRDFLTLAVERYRGRCPSVWSAYDAGDDPLGQLDLLSRCRHAVISNSSYAWWGAWLGDQRIEGQRLVVAPDRWNEAGSPVVDRWVVVSAERGTTAGTRTTIGGR